MVQKAAVPLVVPKLITLQHFDAEGGDLDAECSIWAKAPFTQPTANGYTKVVNLGWWVVVVGTEPVHDSLHVTYRLLAPGTEPSRGPQPMIKLCQYIHLEYSAHVACSLWVHFARRVLD